MSIRHLLHPVPVKYHHRHRYSPIAQVTFGGPPTAVVKWSCALPNCWMPAARLTSLETLASMTASGCAFRNDLMPPRSMR